MLGLNTVNYSYKQFNPHMRAPSSLNCKVKTFKLFDFVTSYISQHLMRDCSGAFSAGTFGGAFISIINLLHK